MKQVTTVFFTLLLIISCLSVALIYTEVGGIFPLGSVKKEEWLVAAISIQPIILLGLYFSYRQATIFASTSGNDDVAGKTDKILDAVSGCVITVNHDFLVSYINDSAKKLIGFGDECLNQPISFIFSIQDRQGNQLIHSVVDDQRKNPKRDFRMGQVKLVSKSQGDRYINLSTRPILIEGDEAFHGIVFAFRDVTADRKVMNELYRQASQDALTGLINRASFERSLEHVLQTATNSNLSHSLLYIDLDHFKIVNDTCGHNAGDELLKQIAQSLTRYVRQIDKVARMGGDEFAILLQACPLSRSKKIAESILDDLRSFRFSWQEKSFVVGASIGLVEFDGDVGRSLKGLLNAADQACYMAKRMGRDQYSVLDMDHASKVADPFLLDWKHQLTSALADDTFSLQVQPIVPLQKERLDTIQQYEVLIRLEHENNIYKPGSFIPAAERLGLMKDIDRWVISQVLQRGRQSVAQKQQKHYHLSINLSEQSIQDASLLSFIQELFTQTGMSPALVSFEVSESVAVANFSLIKTLFTGLRELGCGRVLDDFGSGFSSLSYLREIPVNYLKIDGVFVRNLVNNDVDEAMVRAISQVGKVMNLFTIAEAVEDDQTLDALRHVGVDFAQGYLCGKPVSFETICPTVDSTLEKTMDDAILLE